MKQGAVLDAGAFIALERRDRVMVQLTRMFADADVPLVTSAGVVAQVWRSGSGRQIPVVHLLRRTLVMDITYGIARTLGRMLGARGTSDPIDAHVVFLALERDWVVITSDPDDLLALDPGLRLHTV